jgi:ribosome-binding protein aMBF1 (putative translation factor)
VPQPLNIAKKRPTLNDFDKKQFKNKEFREEYEKLQPEFEFIRQLIIARKASKVSQTELAIRLKTKQPAIARFEGGGFSKASMSTLQEYAEALGYKLKIRLVPSNTKSNQETKHL